ncbi:hypothetical protein GCM10022297_09600 [Lactobacillus hamsteri]|uniref:Acyltransferase 3 domain-containing protein n=1 Tax=Lactobacillus hamsteri DSM 5661 = JCM 6256 TaxID=1423754 RepID=A0A0R1YD33_9LACO|nr:acyltransferase [Lactobacillus hamsteri]KRM39925.1 hypothetical protein FC39_GL000926 [Lactobacillus hamsteri DSM 5661 = JCM 6256]
MKKRDSRFEMVRIISMLFIVMYHFTMYGNWTNDSINTVKIQFFRPWGQVGVALFVMITGYFVANRQTDFSKAWKRIKKLWVKTLFYSWIILICSFIFYFGIFEKHDYLYAIFPVIFDEYWFITSYIVLILLTPVLNMIVEKWDRKNLIILIGIILIFADVVPFIKNNGTPNAPLGNMFSVGAMLAPYLIAAFIRKYNVKVKIGWALGITVLGVLLEYTSLFVLKHGIMTLDISSFTFGLLPLITAVGIFCIFLNLPSFHSKFINWIAAGVLASYLITENPLFRMYFWQKLLNVGRFQDPTWKFILMGILIAIVTVLVCSLIDKVYEIVYSKVYKLIKMKFNIIKK